jgi:hypothetical protein
MLNKYITHITITVLSSLVFLSSLKPAFADVTVYDHVTSFKNTITLRAFTQSGIFSEGGKLVAFYVNKEHIGTRLSGGDGYAFLKYRPRTPGLKEVTAKTGDTEDKGLLLVTKKGDKVLLVEVDNTLFLPQVLKLSKPTGKGKETLQILSKKYKLVFITMLLGMKMTRQWLQKNNFPLSPVLTWRGASLMRELKDLGIKPYAIIGSSDMLSQVPDIAKRFSFQDTENGEKVNDWEQILKLLK